MHTWTVPKFKHIIIKNEKDIPDADFIIATGYKTVKSTVNLPKRCGKKIHWIRGWETWKMSENDIVKNVLNQPTIKIVNSLCLKNKLENYGFKSEIIRPGHDFDQFSLMDIRNKDNSIIIGGLFNSGSKREGKRTKWIIKAFDELNKKNNIKLYIFGIDGTFKTNNKNIYFIKDPPQNYKNVIYNKCDIWLSPSELEGLHIPPAESMLTECCVVGNNSEMSGTQDYLIHNETGLVSENNFDSFLEMIKFAIENKDLRINLGKSGRNKILNLGDRKCNVQKFINFLDGEF